MDGYNRHQWEFGIARDGYYQFGIWDHKNECMAALNTSIGSLQQNTGYIYEPSKNYRNCLTVISMVLDMSTLKLTFKKNNVYQQEYCIKNNRKYSAVVSIGGKGDTIELLDYRIIK